MGLRRTGREAAIRILYSIECTGDSTAQAREDFWSNHKGSAALKEYTAGLVEGVATHRERLDGAIASAATNWTLDRLPSLEKSILRVATFELLECPSIPTAVIVNEAIDIAKAYAGEEAGSFVHGVVGGLAKQNRSGDKEQA